MITSNFQKKMRKGTVDRLKAAMEQDNTIATTDDQMEKTEGLKEEYLMYLGLTHGDLLRLERTGFMVRGYLDQTFKTVLGRVKKVRSRRWVLMIPKEDINDTPNA